MFCNAQNSKSKEFLCFSCTYSRHSLWSWEFSLEGVKGLRKIYFKDRRERTIKSTHLEMMKFLRINSRRIGIGDEFLAKCECRMDGWCGRDVWNFKFIFCALFLQQISWVQRLKDFFKILKKQKSSSHVCALLMPWVWVEALELLLASSRCI
jgi:hypothetical protein